MQCSTKKTMVKNMPLNITECSISDDVSEREAVTRLVSTIMRIQQYNNKNTNAAAVARLAATNSKTPSSYFPTETRVFNNNMPDDDFPIRKTQQTAEHSAISHFKRHQDVKMGTHGAKIVVKLHTEIIELYNRNHHDKQHILEYIDVFLQLHPTINANMTRDGLYKYAKQHILI